MSSKGISVYRCKSNLLPGHNYETISPIARKIFREIERKTKRRPYLRSAYFHGNKIFLDNFWPHLNQKNPKERCRRLRFLKCAIELIQKSRMGPMAQDMSELKEQKFYRFIGKTNHQFFIVQIKEDLKRKQKFLMSIFESKVK